MAEFRFFAFLGFLGVRAFVFFSGTPKRPKIPKNRIWCPVEAVSANFSPDLIVARGDSATDEPKYPDFEPLSSIYVENAFARAPAVGRMPSNLPRGVWPFLGDLG